MWPRCLQGGLIFFWIKFIAVTRWESSEDIARYLKSERTNDEICFSTGTQFQDSARLYRLCPPPHNQYFFCLLSHKFFSESTSLRNMSLYQPHQPWLSPSPGLFVSSFHWYPSITQSATTSQINPPTRNSQSHWEPRLLRSCGKCHPHVFTSVFTQHLVIFFCTGKTWPA